MIQKSIYPDKSVLVKDGQSKNGNDVNNKGTPSTAAEKTSDRKAVWSSVAYYNRDNASSNNGGWTAPEKPSSSGNLNSTISKRPRSKSRPIARKRQRVRKTRNGHIPEGFAKLAVLTPQLAEFVGQPAIPRCRLTKFIWDYAKEHNLKEGGTIICKDSPLRNLFGVESITVLGLPKLLNQHIVGHRDKQTTPTTTEEETCGDDDDSTDECGSDDVSLGKETTAMDNGSTRASGSFPVANQELKQEYQPVQNSNYPADGLGLYHKPIELDYDEPIAATASSWSAASSVEIGSSGTSVTARRLTAERTSGLIKNSASRPPSKGYRTDSLKTSTTKTPVLLKLSAPSALAKGSQRASHGHDLAAEPLEGTYFGETAQVALISRKQLERNLPLKTPASKLTERKAMTILEKPPMAASKKASVPNVRRQLSVKGVNNRDVAPSRPRTIEPLLPSAPPPRRNLVPSGSLKHKIQPQATSIQNTIQPLLSSSVSQESLKQESTEPLHKATVSPLSSYCPSSNTTTLSPELLSDSPQLSVVQAKTGDHSHQQKLQEVEPSKLSTLISSPKLPLELSIDNHSVESSTSSVSSIPSKSIDKNKLTHIFLLPNPPTVPGDLISLNLRFTSIKLDSVELEFEGLGSAAIINELKENKRSLVVCLFRKRCTSPMEYFRQHFIPPAALKFSPPLGNPVLAQRVSGECTISLLPPDERCRFVLSLSQQKNLFEVIVKLENSEAPSIQDPGLFITEANLMARHDLRLWTKEEVQTFIRSLNVEVVKMGVVGSELVDFCEDDLRGLGLTTPFLVKRVFEAIKQLRQQ